MENKFIEYNQSNIFYRTIGGGKAIILIHGFGEDGNIWNDLASYLAKNYFVIIPDLPGSGKSEILKGENISIDDYAEIIKEILINELSKASPRGRFGGAAVSAFGHSMGGYITLAFAEKYPEFLSSFGLIHSSAFADDEQKIETRQKGIQFIKKFGAHEFLKTSIPGLFSEQSKINYQDEIKNLIDAGENFTSKTLIQYQQAMINRSERTAILRSFAKPILFVIGEEDQSIPLHISLHQCHLPVISTLKIYNHTGHMSMIEQRENLNQTILSFLSSF